MRRQETAVKEEIDELARQEKLSNVRRIQRMEECTPRLSINQFLVACSCSEIFDSRIMILVVWARDLFLQTDESK